MTTYWVCVAHSHLVPPVACGARGEGDTAANTHTQRAPHHPTLTTTRLELANKLAGPTTGDAA